MSFYFLGKDEIYIQKVRADVAPESEVLDVAEVSEADFWVKQPAKLIDGVWTTVDEYPEIEWPQPEEPEPLGPTDSERIEALESENNLLKAQISALEYNQEFLEDCLIEVGMVVYA